ncbi:hypothetical protein ES708_08719 [subsurface metagenome]
MFIGVDTEMIKTIKKRLENELKNDKELPYHRREAVEAILYNIDVTLKEREKKKGY